MNKIITTTLFAILSQTASSQDSITLNAEKPISFTSLGTGLYEQSAIYNNATYGFLIDLAKTSNDITANPIDFKINARGGGHNFFTIIGASGNVGIGVSQPSSELEVTGVIELNDTSFISSHTSVSNLVTFLGANSYWNGGSYVTPNNTLSGISLELHNGSRALRMLNVPAGGGSPLADASIGFGGTNTYFNALGGNVGIGITDTAGYKLAVKGSIKAEEVIVETTWSDFVFEDGYRLRTLEEVESHIEEHGHLPDVPSAALVKTEGLSVGETQKIMMQKIEELTLYVIDLKKENDALKFEVEKLKSN